MIDINEAVKKEYQKYQGKLGRPKGRNMEKKTYASLTISITKKQKDDIHKYADKHHGGNVSMTIKEALKKMKVFK